MTDLVPPPASTPAAADRAPAVLTGRLLRLRGGRVVRYRPRTVVATSVLLLLAFAVGAVSMTTGDFAVPLQDVVASLAGQGDAGTDFIVLELRLPRVLTALLVGAALGVSGAIFQTITRNPLGSPDFVGLTLGASTGALVVVLFIGAASAATVTLGAFAGCLLTSAAVYLLAFKGGMHGVRLVLVGVGVAAMLEAFNVFLITRARLEDAVGAQIWLIGSLNGADWQDAVPLLVAVAVLLPITLGFARRMGMLGMGDDVAAAVGVPVERTRTILLGIGVLFVALATAAAGPVAFVALAAPQLAMRLTRSTELGIVAPAAVGALIVVVSDWVAQRLITDNPLPVGVVTAAVGGLYLVWLLVHEWRGGAIR